MPQPHPRIQGGTEPYGQIRIPRIQGGAEPYGQIRIPDGLLFNVFRAPDGRFYTDHPRLKGPFRNYLRLRNAICHFFGCRNLQLRVTQGGPTIRPRGTRRASSPVVTEDSPSLPLPPPPPPPPPPYDHYQPCFLSFSICDLGLVEMRIFHAIDD